MNAISPKKQRHPGLSWSQKFQKSQFPPILIQADNFIPKNYNVSQPKPTLNIDHSIFEIDAIIWYSSPGADWQFWLDFFSRGPQKKERAIGGSKQ
jgi:hypothetical protein